MSVLQENIELRRLAMSVAGEPTLEKISALVDASIKYGEELSRKNEEGPATQ